MFDTDIGNDVDDVLALGVVHALQSRGACELLAVTVTKDHDLAGPFADLVNTFYGRPHVPVGVVRKGVTPQEGKFLGMARDPAYPHAPEEGRPTPRTPWRCCGRCSPPGLTLRRASWRSGTEGKLSARSG